MEVEIRSEIQASLIWFFQQKRYSRITKENSLFSIVCVHNSVFVLAKALERAHPKTVGRAMR